MYYPCIESFYFPNKRREEKIKNIYHLKTDTVLVVISFHLIS